MSAAGPQLVIFDCDGVLVDSEPIANRVLREQLARAGLAMSLDEVMRTFIGRTRAGCIALAGERLGRALPDAFGDEWDAALFDALGREVRAVEGVDDAIRALAVPFCVASNSTHRRVRLSLGTAGLLPHFGDRVFSAADVARPKPAPDLFLHAARTMRTEASRCVVVEDTPTGVRAAVAAGMAVLGFAGAPHADPGSLRAEGATVFERMADLPALLASRG